MNPLDDNSVRTVLKDSDYGRVIRMIENGAFNEAAILTPAYSRVIDDILGEQDARLAAGTSLAVCIIRTTKLLEDVANRDDLDEDRIRQFALHLLPLDFVDIANRAVKNVEGSDNEEPRPIRPLRRKAAIIDRTRTTPCRRCGREGHQYRKCPDYVCCICDELGPDHLSIHCPRLDGRIVLQEFRDDEKFFEALVDWEHNHKTLADLELRYPAELSPVPETPASFTPSTSLTPLPTTPTTEDPRRTPV
ncbi:hypothetical protein EV424DRAFT_1541308 [Suillus variegatus]|nr:hypothetical protein EV424DRAFT_1541308 [Suillus variegatus]